MREKTYQDYKDFDGTDVDIETSLFEYGLIWTIEGDDYKFIYGVAQNVREDESHCDCNYGKFDYAFVAKNCDVFKEYDWADFDCVFDFCGMSKADWSKLPLPLKISDLLSYYGYENIFGSSYGGYEILSQDAIDAREDEEKNWKK